MVSWSSMDNNKRKLTSLEPKSILLQSTAAKNLEAIHTSPDQQTNDETNCQESNNGVNEVINLHAFSTIQRLLRVTAWVLRFANNTKKKTKKPYSPYRLPNLTQPKHYGLLTVSQLYIQKNSPTYKRRHQVAYP